MTTPTIVNETFAECRIQAEMVSAEKIFSGGLSKLDHQKTITVFAPKSILCYLIGLSKKVQIN